MKWLSYLIPLIIGALIAWSIIPTNNDKSELKRQQAVNQHKIDSVADIVTHLKEREAYWILTDNVRRDSFNVAMTQLKIFQHTHEKSVPVIHYNAPALDSVIRTIIGR